MLKRGEAIEVYANQAMRDAIVLSVVMRKGDVDVGDARHAWMGQALVEYVMPAGRTFLRVLPLGSDGEPMGDGRPVSYEDIPIKFLADMRENFSAVLGVLKGGYDAGELSAYSKRRHRAYHDREGQKALAMRAKILDLKVPNKEVS